MLPKGRWVKINSRNPDAVARCDRSGLLCNYKDLVKQYDYRGTGLIWTGLYVNKYFLDKPNPQNMNPVIKPDPVPVEHPRPWYVSSNTLPLGNNPLTTTMNSNVVIVTVLDSSIFNNVQIITVSGALSTGGLTPVQLNISALVTIINSTQIVYTAGGTATFNAIGGGSSVVITFNQPSNQIIQSNPTPDWEDINV